MTVRALAVASALEAAVIAVAGVAIGAAAAQIVLLPLVGGPAPGASGAVDVAVPAVATLVTAVLAAVVTMVVSVRALTDAPGAVEAGRSRTAVSAGLAVLAVIAAAVTLWRFVAFSSSGSLADGTAGVDPAGVVAPAAVLCAIALVGLSLFGPAAAAVERLAGRGRGVARVLPARQVGRGIALFAGPVALIVLAVGSLSFAAGYAGTFAGFLHDSTLLVQGAPVRADLGAGGSPRSASDLSPAAALQRPGVTASPAIVEDATVGDTDAALVVADAALLPALAPVGAYLFDGRAAASALHAANGIPGADLSSGPRTLRVKADATAGFGAARATAVTAWLATDAGEVVPVTASVAADGTASLAVPPGSADRLVGLDVAVVSVGAVDVKVAVSGLPRASSAWTLAPDAFAASTPFRAAGAAAASAAALDAPASVRFVPDGLPPLRFAVTMALAADDDLAVGRRIEVRSPAGDLTGTVARIVAAVPGTASERAVLADYAAVSAQLLRTTPSVTRASSVWASGGDTSATATALSRAAGAEAVVTTADGGFVSRFLGGAVLSTWLGAAGCAVLALAAVAAAVSSALRRRRGEVVVLRAVGLSGRQQAWTRRLEVIGVTVAAGVFGLVGGVAVVLLVGNTLARLSVVTAPSTLSVQGRVDPLGLGLGLLALTAALAAAVWAYGSAVRRQAADTGYREETR
ncbi:FtsX-like permease family protein [Leifsonia poae]|uniref:FtsX-like permease family protein n=1 Tax=Leifsonia poae TaxID=110933 RepID=UPI003D6907F0